MADPYRDPPLHTKATVVLSSFGWMVGALLSAGTVVWCREVRRIIRGK